MAATHAHDHHHHHHNHAEGLSESRLKLSLAVTGAFVLVEGAAGFHSHSLALLSDAGHNLTDAAALGLAWYALVIARRPATATKTYGYHRAGILTALANAVTLLLIAIVILVEAIARLRSPRPVESGVMIGVAAIAVLMNTVIAMWLRRGAEHDMNMRGAFIHMIGDALSAAGVIVAGAAIHFLGWLQADSLISIVIGLLIAYSSWGIVTEAVNVLLEGAPKGMDLEAVAGAMRSVQGVGNVHDLHVWTIADGMHALSCHLRVSAENEPDAVRIVREVKALLNANYHVTHSTIETECGGCDGDELLYCHLPEPNHGCSH